MPEPAVAFPTETSVLPDIAIHRKTRLFNLTTATHLGEGEHRIVERGGEVVDNIADHGAKAKRRVPLDIGDDADVAIRLIQFERLGIRLFLPTEELSSFRYERLEMFVCSIELGERVIKRVSHAR